MHHRQQLTNNWTVWTSTPHYSALHREHLCYKTYKTDYTALACALALLFISLWSHHKGALTRQPPPNSDGSETYISKFTKVNTVLQQAGPRSCAASHLADLPPSSQSFVCTWCQLELQLYTISTNTGHPLSNLLPATLPSTVICPHTPQSTYMVIKLLPCVCSTYTQWSLILIPHQLRLCLPCLGSTSSSKNKSCGRELNSATRIHWQIHMSILPLSNLWCQARPHIRWCLISKMYTWSS